MTDSRIKVRRQSHSCVRDTLLNLQGNAALAPASEAITKSVDSLEILCITLKANKRNRNRAYDLLVQSGHTFGDEENGGKKENLYQFFNMVAGGLALESPHDQCSNERHGSFGIRVFRPGFYCLQVASIHFSPSAEKEQGDYQS
ncbi:RRP12 protein [Salix suchowensis]|nr:RRP12 protein [Salix suchowensis]